LSTLGPDEAPGEFGDTFRARASITRGVEFPSCEESALLPLFCRFNWEILRAAVLDRDWAGLGELLLLLLRLLF
jgi:hypothetical protein